MGLALEAVTGLWIQFAPFSALSQLQVLAHGAAGLLLPALLALSLLVRCTGLAHEAEGRYYADEGTYYHHAKGIEAGQPLRLSFTYPHLLYDLDAVALWLLRLFPGAGAAHESRPPRAPHLSVPAAGSGDRTAQSSVGQRYYLHPDAPRLYVSGRHHRLV